MMIQTQHFSNTRYKVNLLICNLTKQRKTTIHQFVNLLYISVWRYMEFESSYRYLISCFHIIFVSLVISVSKLEESSKF